MIYPLPDKLTLPVVPEYFAVPEYKYEVELMQTDMSPELKQAMGMMLIIGTVIIGAILYTQMKSRSSLTFKSIEPKPLKRKNSKKLN